ncbi:MAG TPA: DUF2794 domain-containing protein [Micropepsaceae bacterium]|jgi:hypothetical protein|nr:DUF2794 domain-containing protein [Micropepsaceae bacterium]
MSDEPIVFGRAEAPPFARTTSWGTQPDGAPVRSPEPRDTRIRFDRVELKRILNTYGRMVMAGEWRDYAIDFRDEVAVFSVFRRASEAPLYTIEKRPRLKERQGQYSVVAPGGQVLKRGHDLAAVLRVLDRKLLKAVAG